jgi:hypothetical protein
LAKISGGNRPRRLAPAAITADGSTLGTLDRRLEIRMLLKMDSPVETKMAAPRSWKTV